MVSDIQISILRKKYAKKEAKGYEWQQQMKVLCGV